MSWNIIELSDPDFLSISKYITANFGLKLPMIKKILIQSRLQLRLQELKMNSFSQYRKLLENPETREQELKMITNYVSTNKTSFFREEAHFSILGKQILPELFRLLERNGDPFLRCWSAGCSSGQEAFSIAMMLEEYRLLWHRQIDFQIYATDISSKVLSQGRRAVFPYDQVNTVPLSYRKLFLLKSKNQLNRQIKVCQALRKRVFFSYGNLMDEQYAFNYLFDFIFIRNTLIYFQSDRQKQILNRLIRYLKPAGYLFVGHAESLIHMDLPLKIIAPGIYQKITKL